MNFHLLDTVSLFFNMLDIVILMILMDKNVNYNKGLIFKLKFCKHFEIRNSPKQ